MSQVQSAVLEEQVVDKLLESAQVTEVTLGYEDAIKPNAQAEEAGEKHKTRLIFLIRST